MTSKEDLEDIASILRRDVLEMTSTAGSGHPTSCLSSAEIMSVLFFDIMKYDPKRVSNPNNDEFILSKGHAAPILYSVLQRAGCIKENLNSLRKKESLLQGHPIPNIPWIKIASGSLGQGLATGVGFAIASKKQGLSSTTYVLLGDSECAEGSVWEAANLASLNKLDNLYAIVDLNSLGQTGKTMWAENAEELRNRFNASGWATAVVDGHNVSDLKEMLTMMRDLGRPIAIIAKTIKGKGVSFLEGQEHKHGKSLEKKELALALKEIPKIKMPPIEIEKPKTVNHPQFELKKFAPMFSYKEKQDYSTREAFGNAILRIAKADSSFVAVDGEVSDSTFTKTIKDNLPNQFVQAYIAEQAMISVTLGLSKKGHKSLASTFSAFLSRAHDQLRMASISNGNFIVNGSHSGCSIGADGPSQMGLEDIAMFRTLPHSTILYPSDAISSERLTEAAHSVDNGLVYIRTSRPKLPLLYDKKHKFELGSFGVLRESKSDSLILLGAGVTTHESIKAAKMLKKDKISVAVVDLYCISPLNINSLKEFIAKHGNKVIITEDHYQAGGIGEMLAEHLENSNIKIHHLYVKNIPSSGTMEENLEEAGIDAKSIYSSAKKMLKS